MTLQSRRQNIDRNVLSMGAGGAVAHIPTKFSLFLHFMEHISSYSGSSDIVILSSSSLMGNGNGGW
jgi:hypothetical protein